MAVNPSSRYVQHLARSQRQHLPLRFSNRNRVVSIRCQKPNSETGHVSFTKAGSSCSSHAIDFLTLCHRLKSTKRTGWLNHGIKGSESIADHMYRMALMALIAGDIPDVNRERCIKIAIVHDIAEAIVGDITPHDGVPKAEKSRREHEALNEMCKVLGGGMRGTEKCSFN